MIISRIARLSPSRPAAAAAAARRWMSSSNLLVDGHVQLHLDGRTAVITLNNPGKLNALDLDMAAKFDEAICKIESPDVIDKVGAVVLTGAGRAFSAGGDLKWLMDRHRDTPSRNSVIMREFYSKFLKIRRLPVPTIAAINGAAIGAGMCFAVGCDMRVAAADAKMGFTFTKLGLHPGMASTHLLPLVVGPQTAARLLLTGEIVDGPAAVDLGLVMETADSGDACVDRAMALAETITQNSPVATRTCIRSLRMSQDEGLDRALWREADAQAQTYITQDLAEGVSATAEKRPPAFTQLEEYSN